jgi:ABC-type microcin C transport system duplicated ATPase subunit YejF
LTNPRRDARHLTPTSGQITLEDNDLSKLSTMSIAELQRNIQMVFQDPYSSPNPRHTVGTIVAAPFRIQRANPPSRIKAAGIKAAGIKAAV